MIEGNGVATPIDASPYLISAATEDAFVVLSTDSSSGETVGMVSGLGDGETYKYSQTADGVTTLMRYTVPQRSFECGVTHDHHIGGDFDPLDRLLSNQQNLRGTTPGDIGHRELQSKYIINVYDGFDYLFHHCDHFPYLFPETYKQILAT